MGHKRYAFNVLEGTYRERPVCCFEYHYETYSSDSKGRRQTHHHYLTAAAIHLPHGLGYLMVRPENIFDKLAGAVGFNDIDFESVEFSRRFYVKSLDRKFAYDIIHARTMEFLLHRVARGFAFELAGPALLLYNGARWRPEQVPDALDWLVEFVELIPDYVWHDAKEQGR